MSEQTIAERLSKLLKYDGVRVVFTVCEGEDYEALSTIVHGTQVDEDTAYDEVQNALKALSYTDCDEVEDNIYEHTEADIYNANLIEWLGVGAYNYCWCDDEMEEFGGEFNSIIAIISAGQSAAKRCVWNAVLDLVRELAEEEESD